MSIKEIEIQRKIELRHETNRASRSMSGGDLDPRQLFPRNDDDEDDDRRNRLIESSHMPRSHPSNSFSYTP